MTNRFRRTSANGHSALQRLFALQEFSPARYVAQAQLYGRNDAAECLTVVLKIAEGQESHATQVGRLLTSRRVPVEHNGFSLHLTGLNDVSASYVAQTMLTKQPRVIAAIRKEIARLSGDSEGQRLAHEILASEEENLRQLRRVVGGPTVAACNLAKAA